MEHPKNIAHCNWGYMDTWKAVRLSIIYDSRKTRVNGLWKSMANGKLLRRSILLRTLRLSHSYQIVAECFTGA